MMSFLVIFIILNFRMTFGISILYFGSRHSHIHYSIRHQANGTTNGQHERTRISNKSNHDLIYFKYKSSCCGPGDITKDMILPALDPNAVVIGTDVSKNMIDYANKKYSVPKKLEYDVLDIQTKNLPTKYISEFDFIFSFNALHWCNDIKQTFENIYRMLQPNGTMLILFVASHNIFKVFEKLANDARFAQYITDINKYVWPFQKSVNPRKELKKLLEIVGFTVNHCSHRETFHFDENPDRFFSSIVSFLDFIEDMPSDKKEEFKKEFARKYAETQIICKQKNDQNTVVDVYRVLQVFAKKRMP